MRELQEAIDHWQALKKQSGQCGISFAEGMRLLAGASADLKHEDETAAQSEWVHVSAGDEMRKILAGLREPETLDHSGLTRDECDSSTLSANRCIMVAFRNVVGAGACLADDMGLGKTIQVLALLLDDRTEKAKRQSRPSLLVVPASLLGNWRNEASPLYTFIKTCVFAPGRNRPFDIGTDSEIT